MKIVHRITTALAAAGFAPLALGLAVAAPAHAAVRPASCGNYVVASNPLRIGNTTLPYSDGYVQLWYNSCTDDNFAHTVSELPGTTYTYSQVHRSDGAYAEAWYDGWDCSTSCAAPYASPQPTNVYSPELYSPIKTDYAYGYVEANGVIYWAQTASY